MTAEADIFELAACYGVRTNIFYPNPQKDPTPGLKYCLGCPIMLICRNYAFQNNEVYGIWGGMTESERKKAVRRCKNDPMAVANPQELKKLTLFRELKS